MRKIDELKSLREKGLKQVSTAKSIAELDAIEIALLGRKGELTQSLRLIGSLPVEEKAEYGKAVNSIKVEIANAIENRKNELNSIEENAKIAAEAIDVTAPGRFYRVGHPHILVNTITRIKEIFIGLGYEFVESPEIEKYRYNFEALNYPEEHPALDEQMSFYIDDSTLLRTHTTAYQHRVMLNRKPPMRAAVIGKCYRSDAVDATHNHTFHQVDCFCIDKGISMSDLKGTIHQFAVEMFGKEVNVRFRPDFFPFVEPGAEFSVTCIICGGDGCSVCKRTGFLELGGAGMIHPNVLEGAGIDSEIFSGFAFGFGIERMPMLSNSINDIRLFMENDLRFLRQL